MAIDPDCFAPGFIDRMDDLNKIHRDLPAAPDAPGPVLVPGDPERIHMEKCDKLDGIPYPIKVVEHFNNLAVKIGVKPLDFKKIE